VVIEAHPDFLYNADWGQDGIPYEQILAERKLYQLAGSKHFPDIACDVRIYRLDRQSQAPPVALNPPFPPPVRVGRTRWLTSEDTWRHYWNPLIYQP
jgi:hypothetical protein